MERTMVPAGSRGLARRETPPVDPKMERMGQLARQVLTLSRDTLLVHLRYLDTALSQLEYTPSDATTLMTDGEHLLYNPIHVLRSFSKEKEIPVRDYLHVIMHCIYRHMFVNPNVEQRLWNLAADIAVESCITELDMPCVAASRQAEQESAVRELQTAVHLITAEKLYRYFRDGNVSEARIDRLCSLFCVDDHSIWYMTPEQADEQYGNLGGGGDRKDDTGSDDDGEDREQKNKKPRKNRKRPPQDEDQEEDDPSDENRDPSDGDQPQKQQKKDPSHEDHDGENSDEDEDSDENASDEGDAGENEESSDEDETEEDGSSDGDGTEEDDEGDEDGEESGEDSGAGDEDGSGENGAGQDAESAGGGNGSEAVAGAGADSGGFQSRSGGFNLRREDLAQAWKDIAEHIQTDLETFSKMQGDQAGGMVQNLREVNRDRTDYGEFLRRFCVMGEVMKIDPDEFDYIFYTYGLQLNGNMPLIEQLEYREVRRIKDFVIAIDTSGSVEGDTVQQFVEKTYGILRSTESFFTKVNVYIIQCDAEIQEEVKITSLEEFEQYGKMMQIHGLGGTDFRPVFRRVEELRKSGELQQMKGLIYFTDGYGTFPERMPDYQTAFVFLDDAYNNPVVPPWAIRLTLGRDEICDADNLYR